MNKRALICGVTGQDGALLAKLLLGKGYDVWGTSRDADVADLEKLSRCGISGEVPVLSMVPTDFRNVLNVLTKVEPDELYLLNGPSSVGLSFDQPAETIETIVSGTLNVLEAMRILGKSTRVYQASSSECFGDVPDTPADETTPFNPRSPYGVAKASAHWLVANYREAYELFCCNGILFNHESPLRPSRFVTRKIVSTACRIQAGSPERLTLGRLDVRRDWGWAPDFVEAMHGMLQMDTPEDYVIATGVEHTLEEFVSGVFSCLGLEYTNHVDVDSRFYRPSEIARSVGNPEKAAGNLGWNATVHFDEMISLLVEAEKSRIV